MHLFAKCIQRVVMTTTNGSFAEAFTFPVQTSRKTFTQVYVRQRVSKNLSTIQGRILILVYVIGIFAPPRGGGGENAMTLLANH